MSLNPFLCRRCAQRVGAFKYQHRSYHDRWLQHKINAEWEWKDRAQEVALGERKGMLEILEERGYVHQVAGGRTELDKLLNAKRIGAYVGVDPTAPSLHVGHLIPFMALFHMYLEGYGATTLLGGSTAQYGDPTGRTSAREQLGNVDRKNNITHMHKQLSAIWTHVEALGRKYGYEKHRYWKRALLNNNVWLNKVPVHEVLKLMGGGLRMGTLLSRDTVKTRMESKEGMSLAEFCYPMLQAWDWWHMYQANGTQLQIGGSDQFGNITTGIEGVKHVAKNHPHHDVRIPDDQENWEPMGFTVPLLTTSTGEKFGKSAGNAVWLNADMTPSFDLYAYLLSTPDRDTERLLKLLTFLPLVKITEVMEEHRKAPEKRVAQHLLASEFLELVHGPQVARDTAVEHNARASQRKSISLEDAFAKAEADAKLTEKIIAHPHLNVQSVSLGRHVQPSTANNTRSENVELDVDFLKHANFPAVLQAVGLVNSKSEGHRLIMNRGVYIAKYRGDLQDQLDWTAIRSTMVGNPLSWVVWDGPRSSRGLLALRVGKWKVKIVHVLKERPRVPVAPPELPPPMSIAEGETSESTESMESIETTASPGENDTALARS